MVKNVILFASGNGSNVAAILSHCKHIPDIHFPVIVTNNPKAGVIQLAKENGIDVLLINKAIFDSAVFLDTLERYKPSLLVLAGFLWRVPAYLIEAFPKQIINIHPALLPKYGGKGMYGHHVHEAVIANAEKQSGITIHMVNEEYDEGTILLQKTVDIAPTDTAQTLASKVLALEHEWYVQVIRNLLKE
jgi:phosphoribosylglycinamide formyltransferase-1